MTKKASKYGLRFRPITGNSVFWYNVDHSTHHANRPPGEDNIKIGLNTMTRVVKHFDWIPFDN